MTGESNSSLGTLNSALLVNLYKNITIKSDHFQYKIAIKKAITYISDLNLDGGVVVGSDECVRGGTLSWNVQVDNLVLIVLHYRYRFIF